jgi:uncharacterized membrane protein YecN with MAPEG domain
MIVLKTTLCLAAAAALVNFWLGMRIGQLRMKLKIFVGDDGNELMVRRMRAQANLIEQAPLFVILAGAIELAGRGGMWLAPVAAAFIIGRIAHAIGMDGKFNAGRPIGMATSLLPLLWMIVVAVRTALGM